MIILLDLHSYLIVLQHFLLEKEKKIYVSMVPFNKIMFQ